jgi:hypothetical protein
MVAPSQEITVNITALLTALAPFFPPTMTIVIQIPSGLVLAVLVSLCLWRGWLRSK